VARDGGVQEGGQRAIFAHADILVFWSMVRAGFVSGDQRIAPRAARKRVFPVVASAGINKTDDKRSMKSALGFTSSGFRFPCSRSRRTRYGRVAEC